MLGPVVLLEFLEQKWVPTQHYGLKIGKSQWRLNWDAVVGFKESAKLEIALMGVMIMRQNAFGSEYLIQLLCMPQMPLPRPSLLIVRCATFVVGPC